MLVGGWWCWWGVGEGLQLVLEKLNAKDVRQVDDGDVATGELGQGVREEGGPRHVGRHCWPGQFQLAGGRRAGTGSHSPFWIFWVEPWAVPVWAMMLGSVQSLPPKRPGRAAAPLARRIAEANVGRVKRMVAGVD